MKLKDLIGKRIKTIERTAADGYQIVFTDRSIVRFDAEEDNDFNHVVELSEVNREKRIIPRSEEYTEIATPFEDDDSE